MQLRELIPHLSGVRRGWNGYAAKCPAHEDKHQSLSIAEGDGRILLKCFAGCDTSTIVKSLGLTWRDLFDKSIEKPSTNSLGNHMNEVHLRTSQGAVSAKSKGRIHTIYPYVDEKNRLLYENVRYHPKGFRQRRYNVGGEAVWSLEGVRRVPYRLPELIKAAEDGTDIFLCEGEKDADALRELGLTATSFKNWIPEFNPYVQGLHVVVVADHDRPGATQANEAARLLLQSAASVKLLDVFSDRDMPDSHGLDISDYIRGCVEVEGMDADAIKERLCIQLDNLPRWKD